jgi:hypothetical protein
MHKLSIKNYNENGYSDEQFQKLVKTLILYHNKNLLNYQTFTKIENIIKDSLKRIISDGVIQLPHGAKVNWDTNMYEDMNIKAFISMGLNRDYVPYFHCDTIKSVTTADKQSISVTDIVYTIDDVQDSVQDIFDKIYEED